VLAPDTASSFVRNLPRRTRRPAAICNSDVF